MDHSSVQLSRSLSIRPMTSALNSTRTCCVTVDFACDDADLQVHRRTNSATAQQNTNTANNVDHHQAPTSGSEAVGPTPVSSNGSDIPVIWNEDNTEPGRCGIFCFHPSCLEKFAAPIPFLLTLCGIVMAQSLVVSGLLASINTTIEKRYDMSSLEIGYIYSCYEISCILSTFFISYFGHRKNRARLLGVVTILLCVGYILLALPQFISSRYYPRMGDATSNHLCSSPASSTPPSVTSTSSGTSETACDLKETQTWALLLFCLAQLVIGVGASPIYVLGPTYLWDNVTPRQYPIYSAMMYVSGAVGPALGFLLGAWFLSIYVDEPWHAPPSGLTPSHPQWLGAWWIGLVGSAGLALAASIPLLCFPKRLPSSEMRRRRKEAATAKKNSRISSKPQHNGTGPKTSGDVITEADVITKATANQEDALTDDADHSVTNQQTLTTVSNGDVHQPGNHTSVNYGKLKDLPSSLKRLFTNRVWVSVSLLNVMEQSVATAFVTYISKYLQTMFKVPAHLASITTGGVVIPSAITGVLIGAVLMRQCRLSTVDASKLMVGLCFSTTLLSFVLVFMGCPGVQLVGVTLSYPSSAVTPTLSPPYSVTSYNLTNSCNALCSCSVHQAYKPICSSQSKYTYFSPCHAGCLSEEPIKQDDGSFIKNYTHCGCIEGSGTALEGKCSPECSFFLPTLILVFIQIFLTAIGQEPVHIITLSSVSSEDSSFALGMQIFLVRIFAYIPAPIYFGKLYDYTCILHADSCDGTGACLEYDLDNLPFYWLSAVCGLKFLGVICALIMWYAARQNEELNSTRQNSPSKSHAIDSSLSLNIFSKSVVLINIKPDPAFALQHSETDSVAVETIDTSISSLQSERQTCKF